MTLKFIDLQIFYKFYRLQNTLNKTKAKRNGHLLKVIRNKDSQALLHKPKKNTEETLFGDI